MSSDELQGEVYFLRILRQVKTQQASESTDLAPLVENDAAEIEDDADEVNIPFQFVTYSD